MHESSPPPPADSPGIWTGPAARRWELRGEAQRAAAQLAGIDAWHRQRRLFEQQAARPVSREAQRDLARRREALRRQREAILGRTQQALDAPLLGLRHLPLRRAVLAHRDVRIAEQIRLGLAERGIGTVAVLDDGAEAVGVAVAEQPDLLLLEDRLQTMTVAEVLQEAALLCPATVTVVQAEAPDAAPPLLDAGAVVVFSRRVPPLELCRHLDELLAVDRPVDVPRQTRAHARS